WTLGRYQRNRRFDQSPDTVRQIRGVEQMDTLLQYVRDKQLREGITHSTNAYVIILWEHWVKTDNGWTVYTYSPQNPELEIRKPFGCPYKFGGGGGGGNSNGISTKGDPSANGGRSARASLPFFSFQAEVKDEGWYSPRGLGELLAPVEAYLSKLWNEKSDAITFSNRPVLTADGDIPNVSSLRWQPGEIIPMNIRGVSMPAPPISYDEELAFAAGLGEQQAMMPDFGISDLTNNSQGKPRTATENQRISALQSAGSNDNAMIFRDSLTACYRHIWGLLCQFKGADFAYYAAGGGSGGATGAPGIGMLPEAALHDGYMIFPDGAPDGWNRQKRLQMAIARLQAFQNNPNVSMEELTKEALYADDPRLAMKAFIPTNQKANSEAEAEAIDILVLKEGYPAAVLPGEDHATRILVDLGWLQKQGQIGAPVDPVARQRVQEHMQMHWQYLKQTDPKTAKELGQKIAQMEKVSR
ncbi:MAG TPA: hypothetical protein VGY98_01060, partial [Verrucomicrobiae bacterium]|nr:hypothetical protein [Verrucomicrobiae bacterium]